MSAPFGRRLALTGAAGALAGGAAPDPDPELIRACAEFSALERRTRALYPGEGAEAIVDDAERDAAIDPHVEAQEPLVDRLCELRATTPAGHAARARALALWAPEAMDAGPGDYWEQRMLAALLRDLAGEG